MIRLRSSARQRDAQGRLKALEEENRRLKQLLAETMLDNQALKGLLAKNW